MGLLTPTRRIYHRWRSVLPLYDGRSCPDCSAVVCGREDRRVHRERHMREEAWQEWAADSIIRIAKAAGLPVIDHQGDEDRDSMYTRVLNSDQYDDEEEDDDEQDDH